MEGRVNHVIVIESLTEERETGTELYNDVIRREIDRVKSPISHALLKTNSKNELLEELKKIEDTAEKYKGGLLLHLEMHGAADLTGLILSDNSLVTWEELISAFRPINVKSSNNLYLSIATCNGRFLYKGIKPDGKSPYRAFISASKAVFPSEIVEQYSILFANLIESGNLIKAYLQSESTKSQFFYKDSKTTFEEAFQSTADRFMTDPSIRKSIMDETEAQVKALGLEMPAKFAYDYIVRMALRDTYNRYKKTFDI